MKFAPTDDQKDFATAIRKLVTAADVPAAARQWADGSTDAGVSLWGRLGDLGVHALVAPESIGGFGNAPVELALAFTEIGRAGLPGPYVESAAFLPTLLGESGLDDLVSPWVSGSVIATVASLPEAPYAVDAGVAGDVLVIDGLDVRRGTAHEAVRSVDPTRSLSRVEAGEVLTTVTAEQLQRARDAAALATAAQLYGASLHLLDASVEYVKARRQFGRAIGEYQAVKHQLADVKVAVDFTRPLIWGAALAAQDSDPSASIAASSAKVAASRSALLAARTALQVHGAIGYTNELDLSLWLTKVRAMVSTWGTVAHHRARILEHLTTTERASRVLRA